MGKILYISQKKQSKQNKKNVKSIIRGHLVASGHIGRFETVFFQNIYFFITGIFK